MSTSAREESVHLRSPSRRGRWHRGRAGWHHSRASSCELRLRGLAQVSRQRRPLRAKSCESLSASSGCLTWHKSRAYVVNRSCPRRHKSRANVELCARRVAASPPVERFPRLGTSHARRRGPLQLPAPAQLSRQASPPPLPSRAQLSRQARAVRAKSRWTLGAHCPGPLAHRRHSRRQPDQFKKFLSARSDFA